MRTGCGCCLLLAKTVSNHSTFKIGK